MNSIRKVALACMTAAMVTVAVNAGAQGPANQDTYFTFSQPVELPKTTLPAGTYFFQLMDSPSNRHIVRVMSQDRTKQFAMLMAIPYYSNDRPSDEPQVRFLEVPAANNAAASNAIKIWFYPGNSVGHEFIWPREKAMALARATNQPVLTTKTDAEDSELTRVDASGADAAVANDQEASRESAAASTQSTTASTQGASTTGAAGQSTSTAQREQVGAITGQPDTTTAQTPAATSAPRTTDTSRTGGTRTADAAGTTAPARSGLPNTAGPLPLLALMGLGSLVGSRVLRRARQ
jgi:hypothetical protein